MKMQYFNWSEELYVELEDKFETTISIKDGRVEIELDGEYQGPSIYWFDILIYDMCGLIELAKECSDANKNV